MRHVVPIAAGEGIDYNGVAFGMRHGNVEPAGIFLVLIFDSVLLVRIAFGVMLLPFKNLRILQCAGNERKQHRHTRGCPIEGERRKESLLLYCNFSSVS